MFKTKGPITSDDVPTRQLSFDEIDSLKFAANKLFTEGKYGQAIIGYSYAIQQVIHMAIPSSKRQNGENPHKMALAFRESGSRALQAAPMAAILYSNRAQAYLRLSKYDKAAIDADAASTIDPNMFKAWYRKGVAMNNLDKHYEAMVALKIAVKLEPKSDEARALLEEVQYRLGRRPVDIS